MNEFERRAAINEAATERAKLLAAALKSNVAKAGLIKTGQLYTSVRWRTKLDNGGEVSVIGASAKRHGFVLAVVGRKYTWYGTKKKRKIPDRSEQYQWWQGELLNQAELLAEKLAEIDANYVARTSAVIVKNNSEGA